MLQEQTVRGHSSEELLVELSEAAYRVAEQHDFKGAFIDVELDLWYALPASLRHAQMTPSIASASR